MIKWFKNLDWALKFILPTILLWLIAILEISITGKLSLISNIFVYIGAGLFIFLCGKLFYHMIKNFINDLNKK